eukprot:3143340-Amphidinium_carterae.1
MSAHVSSPSFANRMRNDNASTCHRSSILLRTQTVQVTPLRDLYYCCSVANCTTMFENTHGCQAQSPDA